jgi:ATP-binding cassette, subfamily B, bacterial
MSRIDAMLPPVQRDVLGACIGRSRAVVALFLLATIASSAATVGGPLIFAHALKHVGRATPMQLIAYFVAFAATVAATRLLQDVKLVLMNRLEQAVRTETNKDVLAHLLRARSSIFIENNAARISTFVQNLHMSNKIYVQMFMMVLLSGAADILLSFGAIAGYVNWPVALFVVIYGAASVWLTLRSNDATTAYQERAHASTVDGANLLGNVVSNVVTIRIFRAQKWVSALYDRYSRDAAGQWNRFYGVRLRYALVQAALVLVQYASIFAMLVWTLKSDEMLNQIVMVSMILIQLNRPFELIGMSLRDFVVAHGLAQPLQKALDRHRQAHRTGSASLPAGPARIELARLGFAYSPQAAPVLTEVSAGFGPGALNFIVGPSGAGKSSILQILLRLNEDYQGSVRVAGIELTAIDADAYLAAVGYVPQEPMLMNLSIRENVLFGRDHADRDVHAVLEAVRLADKLKSLPQGLDYVIGERGQLLSGGERQRLSIARALIGNPRILLLDEASSALDEDTERSIFAALRGIAQSTTIIAVTHRLGVIQPGDRVLDLAPAQAPAAPAVQALPA